MDHDSWNYFFKIVPTLIAISAMRYLVRHYERKWAWFFAVTWFKYVTHAAKISTHQSLSGLFVLCTFVAKKSWKSLQIHISGLLEWCNTKIANWPEVPKDRNIKKLAISWFYHYCKSINLPLELVIMVPSNLGNVTIQIGTVNSWYFLFRICRMIMN